MDVEKKPIKIIYDTDMGGDCDDAGALALIHRLCDKGEAELLAVTHCYSGPWFAGCIDAINHHYGREVPVGLNYDFPQEGRGIYARLLCELFPNKYPASVYGTPDGAEETVTLLRRVLADAEDGSVTFVVTGALSSMAKLALSAPDEISPMSGKELIAKKLARTVVMGGRFFESWPMVIYPDGNSQGMQVTWEWNIKSDGPAAQTACDNWPGELVFSSYEIGSYIKTLVNYPERATFADPVSVAYQAHSHGVGRCSWDLTAVLDAVRPGVYWNYHEYGKISVDDEFVTRWTRDENSRHTYLLPKTDYAEIEQVIEDLLDGK